MTSATSTSGGGGGAAAFFSSVHPAKPNAETRTIRIKTDLRFTLPPLRSDFLIEMEDERFSYSNNR
jgi:hypothetical protein